jgi:hypothetical protein
VSTFVPKPHTPFQWVPCDSIDQIQAKQNLLRSQLRHPNIKLSWTDPKDTLLEGWLSRGDRRLGEVIYRAWRLGAHFDAWQEYFRFDVWMQAFEEAGLDPAFYTHRTRGIDEIMPWEHISAAVRKPFLLEEYRRSLEAQTRGDCRNQCYACGILPTFSKVRSEHPGDFWKCPEVKPRHLRQPVIRTSA